MIEPPLMSLLVVVSTHARQEFHIAHQVAALNRVDVELAVIEKRRSFA